MYICGWVYTNECMFIIMVYIMLSVHDCCIIYMTGAVHLAVYVHSYHHVTVFLPQDMAWRRRWLFSEAVSWASMHLKRSSRLRVAPCLLCLLLRQHLMWSLEHIDDDGLDRCVPDHKVLVIFNSKHNRMYYPNYCVCHCLHIVVTPYTRV